MAVRRLAAEQPDGFAFTSENLLFAKAEIAKYPPSRQASAIIALLWKAQEQSGGWLPEPAIRAVADMLGLPYIRALEVATFYTMFNLEPVGRYLVQLCGTTPCALRGAESLKQVCRRRIGEQHHVTDDGKFSWVEVECLGACANAPMVQINFDYYEDLTAESFETLLDRLAAGKPVVTGPQVNRQLSAPEGGLTTLTETALYDGSLVGAWRHRFEKEPVPAEAAAAAAAPAAPQPATAQAQVQVAKQRTPGRPEPTRAEQQASDTPADRTAKGKPPIEPGARAEAATADEPGTASGATKPGAPKKSEG
jgi:NADH-quinone oxidoreductase subunit E